MNKTFLKYFLIAMLVGLGISMTPWGAVHAQDISGLNLKLYGGDPENTENVYTLEDGIIPLMVVLKNISGQQLNVARGFSQVELHRALKITDPCGAPLELPPDVAFAYDADMPRFVGGRALLPAEILEADFARSLTIDDLRDLFPVMYEMPGKYTVAAELKGARFFLTEFDEAHGLQGVSNHRSNWFGTIDAKVGTEIPPQTQLTIVILPVMGGRLKLILEKAEAQTIQPLFGIPVKAFVGSITEDPGDVWAATEVEPVLTGITKITGEVQWECNKCLPQGIYTILAKYQDAFLTIEIPEDDSGWGEQCSGVIEQGFIYEEPVLIAGKFSIFGLDSIEIGKGAVVLSGDIGVNAARVESKQKHQSSFVVKVDKGAELEEGVGIYANSISIEKEAVVYDVFYNELENKGNILGEMTTPLDLPVWDPPAFVESVPGEEDILVKGKKGKKDSSVVELVPGAYDEVKIEHNGELHLLEGDYHLTSMKLDKDASLICRGRATILIQDGLEGHDEVYIGPDADSGISAADIVIYIGGLEEKMGKKENPKPKVKKVVIGKKSKVIANIYAPNSTLEIKKESQLEGSFIARDVIVGDKAIVEYNSAF